MMAAMMTWIIIKMLRKMIWFKTIWKMTWIMIRINKDYEQVYDQDAKDDLDVYLGVEE